MLNKKCVTRLINLEGIKAKDIYIERDEVRILVTKEKTLKICPKCGMSQVRLVEIKPKKYRDLNILGSFVEGVNNKINLIKRKSFGFKNFENFRIKIIDCFS
jgi:transposase